MADDKFELNLMRFVAAELFFSVSMQAAHEMYGKGYFSLGVAEKAIVDQAILLMVGGNYQTLTDQFLKDQTSHGPIGFQAPSPNAPHSPNSKDRQ